MTHSIVFSVWLIVVSKLVKSKALYILVVAVVFFIFQLFLFGKSPFAEYNLYSRFIARLQTSDPFWTTFWFSSELVGEVGLALRFVGSCFFLAFGWVLFRKKEFAFSYLRKSVLFEGAYYLFNLPFIVSLFTRPNTTLVNQEAALSFLLQIILVTPAFLVLYLKMRKPNLDAPELFKWGAIGIIGFTLALWAKHFLLNLYALPINLVDPVLLVGFINSALTMLISALILTVTLMPMIRRKESTFNSKAAGVAFILIGIYFIIYVIVSLLNQHYLNYLFLTELWAIGMPILGVSLLRKNDNL